MAGLKKKQRITLVAVGAVLLTVATALVIYAGRDAFEFFRSPSEIATFPPREGERFRLGYTAIVHEGAFRHPAGPLSRGAGDNRHRHDRGRGLRRLRGARQA